MVICNCVLPREGVIQAFLSLDELCHDLPLNANEAVFFESDRMDVGYKSLKMLWRSFVLISRRIVFEDLSVERGRESQAPLWTRKGEVVPLAIIAAESIDEQPGAPNSRSTFPVKFR